MLIEVTQEDIDNGERKCRTTCPIARSLARITKRAWVVDYCEARELEIVRAPVALCQEARVFILDYDRGDKVSPFSFEIARAEQD